MKNNNKKTKDLTAKMIFDYTGLKSKLQDFTQIQGETYDSINFIKEGTVLTFFVGYAKPEDEDYSVYVIVSGRLHQNKIYKVLTDQVKSFYYDYDEHGDYYRGFILGKGVFYEFRKQFSSAYNGNGSYTTTDNPWFMNKVRSKLEIVKTV